MFEETFRLLHDLEQPIEYSMEILPDEDGYIDKECPDEKCKSKFKVKADDWSDVVSKDEAHCPFCGHIAQADSWWTTEQVEQAEEQAIDWLATRVGKAMEIDCNSSNNMQPRNSLFKMQLNFRGKTSFVNLPAEALDEMEQKIKCDNCGMSYAVVGSAFYCPGCGFNSARLTFQNTLNKVRAKINNLDVIKEAILNKDEAERTISSLIESSIPDLVVAFQRLCECIYPQLNSTIALKKNVFQRLADGDALWRKIKGSGYSDWITENEYGLIKKCFQQRHLFQHQDGIVDQDYLLKSGDISYQLGQHIVIKAQDIIEYTDIIEKLGNKVLSFLKEKPNEQNSN